MFLSVFQRFRVGVERFLAFSGVSNVFEHLRKHKIANTCFQTLATHKNGRFERSRAQKPEHIGFIQASCKFIRAFGSKRVLVMCAHAPL